MTVRELREALKGLPGDAPVVLRHPTADTLVEAEYGDEVWTGVLDEHARPYHEGDRVLLTDRVFTRGRRFQAERVFLIR